MQPPPTSHITLHLLTTADGSATYTPPSQSHTLLTGINYPLEQPHRSRELPESTAIEVHFRPHNGVAGVRERHIEEIVKRVLRGLVRGEDTPRCLLQVTLQVTQDQGDEGLPGGVKGGTGTAEGGGYLEALAAAVNVAVLGCLDGGVRMGGFGGAVVVGVSQRGDVVVWPGLKERKMARSLHVFGFGRSGERIVWESEGRFGIEEWARCEGVARRAVCGVVGEQDVTMKGQSEGICLLDEFRAAVEARVVKDERWRGV